MRKLLPFLLMLLAVPAFGQSSQVQGQLTAANAACNQPAGNATPNCIMLQITSNIGAVGISLENVSGATFSGTVSFEYSIDNGVNRHALSVTPTAGGSPVTTATAAGGFQVGTSGLTNVYARVSTYASGTIIATINPSPIAWRTPPQTVNPGTVTSVSGTANQIAVATGASTPVISFDPNPILPATTTATTQTVGDNSTKVATTAFVIANAPAGVTALTAPLVLTGSTGGCPSCVFNPDNPTIIGGIVGGNLNNSLAGGAVLGVSVGGSDSFLPSSMPFAVSFGPPVFYTEAANPAGGVLYFSWNLYDTTATYQQPYICALATQSVAAGGYGCGGTGDIPLLHIPANVTAYGKGTALGTSSNVAGYAWQTYGSTSQILSWNGQRHSVAASTTVYVGPSQVSVSTVTTESQMGVLIPYNSTIPKMCVQTAATQNAGGSLVATLDYIRSGVTTASSQVVTVPAGGTAGFYCDKVDTATLLAGDWIAIKVVNNYAGGASATIDAINMELTPSGSATAMVIFGASQNTVQAGYFLSPYGPGRQTTEVNARGPMPRAAVLKNFQCLVTGTATTTDLSFTVTQNGTTRTPTVSFTAAAAGIKISTDSTHTLSLASLDGFDLTVGGSSGGLVATSSCSAELD